MSHSPYSRSVRYAFFVLLIVSVLGGCASTPPAAIDPTPFYTIIATPPADLADRLSKPENPVILSMTGKIDRFNAQDSLLLNREQVMLAGVVEYDVPDPFLERSVRFRGVLMRDLLALAGAHADAQTLHITALNDYSVDVPVSEVIDRPVLFAMDQDGVPMAPDFRGPAMLVFPYSHFSYDHLVYEALWIWQIASIEVR